MTEQDVRRRFEILIEKHGGTYTAAAKRLGYSPECLSMIGRGLRKIPDPLLLEMGVRKVVVYQEVECSAT